VRIPAKWIQLADKDSRQKTIFEQILIANFGGICFNEHNPFTISVQ
jgi:hypothetical protein